MDDLDSGTVDAKLSRLWDYMDKHTYSVGTWKHIRLYWKWFHKFYRTNLNEAWLKKAQLRLNVCLKKAEDYANESPVTWGSSMDVIMVFRQTFMSGKQEQNAAYRYTTHGRGVFNYIRTYMLEEDK